MIFEVSSLCLGHFCYHLILMFELAALFEQSLNDSCYFCLKEYEIDQILFTFTGRLRELNSSSEHQSLVCLDYQYAVMTALSGLTFYTQTVCVMAFSVV